MRKLAALLLAASAVCAQIPVGEFRISGTLLNASTGEPVRRASLGLQFLSGAGAAQANRISTSDAGGRFEFSSLPAGQYQLFAERRGFPKQNYAPGVTGFPVVADMPDIAFRMQPFAALTGKVSDENGDAIAGATIQLIRSEIQSGKREMRPALSTVTDDRGEYRVASLVSGRYYVSADARAQDAGEAALYARRFFPGVASLTGAVALDLDAGANQRADFRLQPEPAFHIRGQVSGASELLGLVVRLSPVTVAEAFGGTGFPVRFAGEGRFEIAGVTPGQYVLTAMGTKDARMQSASQVLTVGAADVEGVTVAPGPGAMITGHVTLEQTEAGRQPTQIGITLVPEDSITTPVLAVRLNEDRTFTIPEASVGSYTLRVNVPEPFYLKTASAGGLNLLDVPLTVPLAPLELVIGSNGGEVTGTVSVQDKPAAGCTVLLVKNGSVSPSQNKFAVTDANGRFSVRAIAPGEYTAYAWRAIDGVEYRNPQVLTQYSGARVTVAEGAKQTVDLKLNGN